MAEAPQASTWPSTRTFDKVPRRGAWWFSPRLIEPATVPLRMVTEPLWSVMLQREMGGPGVQVGSVKVSVCPPRSIVSTGLSIGSVNGSEHVRSVRSRTLEVGVTPHWRSGTRDASTGYEGSASRIPVAMTMTAIDSFHSSQPSRRTAPAVRLQMILRT